MDDLGAWENGRMHHWRQAALELSDGRTDEFARTALVIALYFLQVASAFTREVGGDPPTPPGGVISCALFLSYLVPAAFLSNCIGAFTSRRVCLNILSRLVEATAAENIAERGNPGAYRRLVGSEVTDWRTFFHSLHYNGGNYTYREFKTPTLDGEWSKRTRLTSTFEPFISSPLPLVSALPVLAGFAGAFPILIYAVPRGFSCRHI